MSDFNPRTPRGVRPGYTAAFTLAARFQSTHPARGATVSLLRPPRAIPVFQSTHPARGATYGYGARAPGSRISIHAPREGCDAEIAKHTLHLLQFQSTHPARGATARQTRNTTRNWNFNPRTPRGVRQQTLPKSREFAWLNLLICTRGRRLSIQKQTRLCSIKLSFMLFGCEPAGEGVSSWTSHATKSKVRLEGRSA